MRTARLATRNHLRVLAYHGVDRADTFAQHMRWIVENLRPVSLDQVEKAWFHDGKLPPGATLVTFDDGQRSVLEQGLPILRQHAVPGVAFVVVGLLGTEQPYWWDEVGYLLSRGGHLSRTSQSPRLAVRELKGLPDAERRGALQELRRSAQAPPAVGAQLDWHELALLEQADIRVENHSFSHPCLPRCSDDVIQVEIQRSHESLTEALGRQPRAFAYPNGDWDERVRAAVSACGYRLAFTFDHRMARGGVGDPLTVSRLRIDSTASIERFAGIVTGVLPALHWARGRK